MLLDVGIVSLTPWRSHHVLNVLLLLLVYHHGVLLHFKGFPLRTGTIHIRVGTRSGFRPGQPVL